MFSLPSQLAINDNQQSNWRPTTGNNLCVPVRCKRLHLLTVFLPISLNQSSFFAFFE
jgi:hypothetical protein